MIDGVLLISNPGVTYDIFWNDFKYNNTYAAPTCEGSVIYTYDYTDCAGLTNSWTRSYDIDLTTAPAEVGGPVSTSSTVNCSALAVVPTLPVIQDACGNVLTGTLVPPSMVACEGNIVYTYNYTDCAGNPFTWTYTYTVDQTVAPVVSALPGSSTHECLNTTFVPTPPTGIVDECGNAITPVLVSATNNYTTLYNQNFSSPITLAPTEAAGVWYTDRYAPNGFASQFAFGGDDRLLQSINVADAAANRPGGFSSAFYNTQGRAFNLTDGTTYSEIKMFVPSAWATSNKRMAGFWGVAVNGSNTVTGYPIVEFTSDVSNPRFRAYDNGTWVDLGLPTGFTYDSWVTCKMELLSDGQFAFSAGDKHYVSTTFGPTSVKIKSNILQGHNYDAALGSIDGGPGVTYDIMWDDFNHQVCEGTKTYNYAYTSCAGLSTPWSYTYTIDHTIAPSEFGGPVTASATYQCASSAAAPVTLPVVKDVCGLTLTPTSGSPTIANNMVGCEGTIDYTYHYIDCSGLTFDWTYSNIIDRTTSPAEVGGPVSTSSSVQCSADATPTFSLPNMVDACGVTLTPGTATQGGTFNGCSGTITYTIPYTDCANLTTNFVYTYNVNDNIAPVISTCAATRNVTGCNTSVITGPAYSTTTASSSVAEFTTGDNNGSVSDNCGIATVEYIDVAAGTCPTVVTRTWTITDACGNTAACDQTINVNDPAIVISCPSNSIQAACQTQAAIDVAYAAWLATVNAATATGGCGTITVTNNAPTLAPPACGDTIIATITATTACGSTTCESRFEIPGVNPVVLNCAPAASEAACQTQTAIDAAFTAWLASTTTTGGCNALLNIISGPASAPSACGGSTSVTWRVTSSCEPPKDCTSTFTVANAPTGFTLTCANQSAPAAACQTQTAINDDFALWLASTTTSNGCNVVLTTNPSAPAAPNACGGSTTVTWTATSSCHATQTCTATYSVEMDTPPTFTACPSTSISLGCNPAAITEAQAIASAGATTDNCTAPLTVAASGGSVSSNGCGRSQTWTVTATDQCNNTATCSVTYTWTEDLTAPVIASVPTGGPLGLQLTNM
ncbi:MAG: hypothetical protein IPI46_01255 [Bacteroidetes bacterium]|nr:hypothetical protein [Bacteroidota bacterium]